MSAWDCIVTGRPRATRPAGKVYQFKVRRSGRRRRQRMAAAGRSSANGHARAAASSSARRAPHPRDWLLCEPSAAPSECVQLVSAGLACAGVPDGAAERTEHREATAGATALASGRRAALEFWRRLPGSAAATSPAAHLLHHARPLVRCDSHRTPSSIQSNGMRNKDNELHATQQGSRHRLAAAAAAAAAPFSSRLTPRVHWGWWPSPRPCWSSSALRGTRTIQLCLGTRGGKEARKGLRGPGKSLKASPAHVC